MVNFVVLVFENIEDHLLYAGVSGQKVPDGFHGDLGRRLVGEAEDPRGDVPLPHIQPRLHRGQVRQVGDAPGGGLVLALHDGVPDAHLLGGHVVLKDSLAVEPDPGVLRAGDGNLDLGICLHVLVHVLLVVGAEPELALQLAGKHKGAALGLAVPAHSGQILHGIGIQKCNDFVHDIYLQGDFFEGVFPLDDPIVAVTFR